MKNFASVSTGAARVQNISLNPQKLAGQCAKLKCCMNYEVNTYVEAMKKLPGRDVTLDTISGTYMLFKSDALAGLLTYTTDRATASNLVTITAKRAFEVLAMNRHGEKPDKLDEGSDAGVVVSTDLAEQDSLTRFDKAKSRKKKHRKPRPQNSRPERGQGGAKPGRRNEGGKN